MTDEPPSLDEFKKTIEALFGQSLTRPASEAAEDFWNHWSLFTSSIAQRSLAVRVDALRLGHNFPQYKRYHVWKGAGTVSLILGGLSVWFAWQIGVAFIVAGIGLHLWGSRLKFNDAKRFADSLMNEAIQNPTKGCAGLCASYIAGIIQLASPRGSAHWPQLPSNAITGGQSFIAT